MFTDRRFRQGLRAGIATGTLGGGWAFAAAGTRRWGRDRHIRGVYADEWSLCLSLGRRLGAKNSLSAVFLMAPSERGLRSASTGEAFEASGDRLYNPAWGYQQGRVRPSRVRCERDADGADYLALRSGHPLEPYYDRFGSVGHLFAFGARLVRRAQSVARLLPLPARFLRESGGVRGRLRGMEAARRPGYADRLGGVVPRQRKSRYAAGRLCAGQRRRSVPELAVRFLFRLPSFPDAAIAGRGACADRPDDRLQPAGRLAQCRFSVRHRPVPDRRSLFRRQIAE